MSYSENTSKTPSEAFPKCPACLSTCLARKRRHVFCRVCDWDSRRACRRYVEDLGDVSVAVTCWPRSLVPERLA